jgi:hypothetical protein
MNLVGKVLLTSILFPTKLAHLLSVTEEIVDSSLSNLYEELGTIRSSLLSMKRALNEGHGFELDYLNELQSQLFSLTRNHVRGGLFYPPEMSHEDTDPAHAPRGQAVLAALMDETVELCHELLAITEPIHDGPLAAVYSGLQQIEEKLLLIHHDRRWDVPLRELSLIQDALRDVEELRRAGHLANAEKRFVAPPSDSDKTSELLLRPVIRYENSAAVTYLLSRCRRLLHGLLIIAEPVSPGLRPLFRELSTVKRLLGELKLTGASLGDREVTMFQTRLARVDSMRRDGKFLASNGEDVPEGQAVLHNLMEDCYDLLYLLME